MKGSINILISTKRLRYELELRRNITIIQGDSASGKTTMIQIISDYLAGKAGPGTKVVCDRKCVVLSGDDESALAKLGMSCLWTNRSAFCTQNRLRKRCWNRTAILYLSQEIV